MRNREENRFRTLFTGERDPIALAAFGRCVRKLVAKVTAYKGSLSAKPERTKVKKGTVHEWHLRIPNLFRALAFGSFHGVRGGAWMFSVCV